MKRCPYCAEEIQDEAIKCRWCMSWLTADVPADADRPSASETEAASASERAPEPPPASTPASAPASTPAPAQAAAPQPAPAAQTVVAPTPTQQIPEKIEFTHTGSRFVLGYANDYFGIWDRSSPSTPTHRFPRTSEGWQAAWVQFTSIESNFVEVAKSP